MNLTPIQFKIEFECKITALGTTKKEAEQELKEIIRAIQGLAKIYKLELKRDYSRTEHFSPLPVKQYEWCFTFRIEGYGKTDLCSYLPQALKYFCVLYSLEITKDKLYFVEKID